MRRTFRSSGDLLADRRYDYAAALLSKGDVQAAADLFLQVTELAPRWPEAWYGLGEAREKAGDRAAAAAAFENCLTLDPDDRLGASLDLSRLDGRTPAAAPEAYVAALFDAYSSHFDAALIERLQYRAPELLLAALQKTGRRFRSALELGCGTGLGGARMRPFVDRLEGVDLSAGMIAEARRKGIYDVLAVKSIADRLAEEGKPFDLIFAADVFSYIGDLEPIFEAIARQLAPGGVAAFTVEKAEERETFPFALRASRRFSHHGTYLGTLAARNRFHLLSIEEADIRQDRGVPIEGLIALIEKP